jgi:hypothetical protein
MNRNLFLIVLQTGKSKVKRIASSDGLLGASSHSRKQRERKCIARANRNQPNSPFYQESTPMTTNPLSIYQH